MKLIQIRGSYHDENDILVGNVEAKMHALVAANGQLWEEQYGHPFERITLDSVGRLVICGGYFRPDGGELDRLSREFGCAL